MPHHSLTFLLAILVWWLSTALILWLCALPNTTFRWTFLGATLVAGAGLYGLAHSAWDVSTGGAYLGFLSALAVWGWIETSFLTGFITGPRVTACPADARGWHRLRLAIAVLLYHELAILIAAGGIFALTWGGPNQTGALAFAILMAMRLSAKLNIFFGVPYLTDEFLPARLSYLKSYFRKGEINPLFPVCIAASSFVAILLARRALGSEGAEAVGFALLFALMALAMLEHFFMIIPLPDAALWRWAMPGKPPERL